jgi:hypothetical protein
MVQVDIPFSFGVGALMATAVETGLRSDRRAYFYLRGLSANLILQMLFVFWLPVYLLASHFGFQTSHMWWHGDTLSDHPTMLPVFVVSYFTASLCGYHLGAWLVLRGRTRIAKGIFVASCLFFAGWMALQPYRTLTLGTYTEWVAGRAVWIWQDQRFMALLGASFVMFVAAARMFYVAVRAEAASASTPNAQRPTPNGEPLAPSG